MSAGLIDPRPAPARPRRHAECEVCGRAFIAKSGNAGRFCSCRCANSRHDPKFVAAARRLCGMTALRCCVPDCVGEWCACAPGTVAEERDQGNLCVIAPAAEVPLVAYCLEHWPSLTRTEEVRT